MSDESLRGVSLSQCFLEAIPTRQRRLRRRDCLLAAMPAGRQGQAGFATWFDKLTTTLAMTPRELIGTKLLLQIYPGLFCFESYRCYVFFVKSAQDTAKQQLFERGPARVLLFCRGSPDLRKTHAIPTKNKISQDNSMAIKLEIFNTRAF